MPVVGVWENSGGTPGFVTVTLGIQNTIEVLSVTGDLGWPSPPGGTSVTVVGTVTTTLASPTLVNISVPNPAVATDWAYTLLTAARLVGVTAVLNCSAAAANRVPILRLMGNLLVTPMCPVSVTASQEAFLNLYVGAAPLGPFTNAAGEIVFTMPLPAGLMLPAGSVVQSITESLQAADQWLAIGLTLSSN